MSHSSAHQNAAQVLTALQRHFLLVNVTFHRWTGRAIVRNAEVELDATPLDGTQVTPPRWRLVPQDLKRTVDRIQSRVRAALSRVSVPFPLKGVHVVPVEHAAELFDKLRSLRADLDAAVDELVLRGYPKLVEEIRGRLGDDVFEKAREHVPDAATMRSRFGIEWGAFTLEARLRARPGRAAAPFVREAEEQFARTVSGALEQLVRRPREELAVALSNLSDRLEDGGTTRKGTLEQVRRAYRKVRAFRVFADEELLAIIHRLDRRIGRLEPQEVNRADRDFADELVKLLRQAAAVASDEAAMEDVRRRARWLRPRPTARAAVPEPEVEPDPVTS